jgi:hypothetical protein
MVVPARLSAQVNNCPDPANADEPRQWNIELVATPNQWRNQDKSPVYQADDSLALKVGVKMGQPLCHRLTLAGSVSANSDGSTIADRPSSRATP